MNLLLIDNINNIFFNIYSINWLQCDYYYIIILKQKYSFFVMNIIIFIIWLIDVVFHKEATINLVWKKNKRKELLLLQEFSVRRIELKQIIYLDFHIAFKFNFLFLWDRKEGRKEWMDINFLPFFFISEERDKIIG